MGKVTSKEIAKLAGVSVSTVSIVLNNKPGVGDSTRQRVLGILASHGIFPKSKGQNMSRAAIRFCKIVKHGHIINDRHNVFISEYIDGVVEEAKAHNLSVEVSTYQNIPIPQIAAELAQIKDSVGFVLLCTELSEEDIVHFSSIEVPHVFLDALFPCSKGSFVTMDNFGMVRWALQYLKECGHKKIGMFTSFGCSNFRSREDAYITSMEALDLEFDRRFLIPVQSTHQDSYEDVKTFLATCSKDSLPTAFFACNDIVAIGAIRALQECGFDVPSQVSVIGFDDLPISSLLSPALTTISVPKISLGKLAVQVLINDWEPQNKVVSQKSMLGGVLIQRASVQKQT